MASAVRGALELKDLSQPRPLSRQMRDDPRAGLEMTARATPMPLLRRRRLREAAAAFTLSGGGKIPAENRRRSLL